MWPWCWWVQTPCRLVAMVVGKHRPAGVPVLKIISPGAGSGVLSSARPINQLISKQHNLITLTLYERGCPWKPVRFWVSVRGAG